MGIRYSSRMSEALPQRRGGIRAPRLHLAHVYPRMTFEFLFQSIVSCRECVVMKAMHGHVLRSPWSNAWNRKKGLSQLIVLDWLVPFQDPIDNESRQRANGDSSRFRRAYSGQIRFKQLFRSRKQSNHSARFRMRHLCSSRLHQLRCQRATEANRDELAEDCGQHGLEPAPGARYS